MIFRCFLAVMCVIALFDVAPTVRADDAGSDSLASKVVTKLIAELFTGAAANCLGEAAEDCKDHWKNPSAAVQCAKDFLKTNKAKCAVGE